MLLFPGVTVVHKHVGIFLTTFIATHMLYGDIEHVLALVRADIATIPVGLLLKIVMRLPNHFLLCDGSKSSDVGKVCWMKQ